MQDSTAPSTLLFTRLIKTPLNCVFIQYLHPLDMPTLHQHPQTLQGQPSAAPLRLLLHRMSAGFPSPAADDTEDSLDLNDYLVRHKPATFMFNVRGDSMRGASIEDGDKVVVDRSLQARHNDIVIAVVEGDYTIKRLHQQYGRIELRPENPAYQTIVLSAERPLEVWGVVVGVVRRLTRRG